MLGGENMSTINNLKRVRELYGATQEQIAQLLSVSRVSVANWENDVSKATSSTLEKLSLYYGIGPEFFYEKELNKDACQIVVDAGKRARDIVERSNGQRNKEQEYREAFENMTFSQAMRQYMRAMKMLLAMADSGELEKLQTAHQINVKMGQRLQAIIDLRLQETASDEPSLFELIGKIEEDE